MSKRTSAKPNFRKIDQLARSLPAPGAGNEVYREPKLRERGLTGPWLSGLAVRVTTAGARSWVFCYYANRIERRDTIGDVEAWSAEKVWTEAAERRRVVDAGGDPLLERKARDEAPTVAALVQLYRKKHLPRKRPRSRDEDEGMIRQLILPKWSKQPVAAVRRRDVVAWHDAISARTPVRANRAHALLHTMFELAIAEEWRADNPCKVEKNHEAPRERYLSPAEIQRLLATLDKRTDQSADAIRLLLTTGARRAEVLNARWDQFSDDLSVWTKPSAHTKQKRIHRIPLNEAARSLLERMKADADGDLLFPAPRAPRQSGGKVEHAERTQLGLRGAWAAVCRDAQLKNVRLHDLRHNFASLCASSGMSLPIIGALLGHTQAQTTQRYSHLVDSALRDATELVSQAMKESAVVVPLRRKGAA